MSRPPTPRDRHPAACRASAPFLTAHAAPAAALVTGVSTEAVALAAVLFVTRMRSITAGCHRYLAHRSTGGGVLDTGRLRQHLARAATVVPAAGPALLVAIGALARRQPPVPDAATDHAAPAWPVP